MLTDLLLPGNNIIIQLSATHSHHICSNERKKEKDTVATLLNSLTKCPSRGPRKYNHNKKSKNAKPFEERKGKRKRPLVVDKLKRT